ncbi:MAG: hypothetical protein V7L20_02150 [Nostoc sp.]
MSPIFLVPLSLANAQCPPLILPTVGISYHIQFNRAKTNVDQLQLRWRSQQHIILYCQRVERITSARAASGTNEKSIAYFNLLK